MLPFADYVEDGDTIYLAVHAKYAKRLPDLGTALIAATKNLTKVRLLLMVFSDRLETLYLCHQQTIESLRYFLTLPHEWREGDALDPTIGVVLYDHAAMHTRKRATLFIFSDGDVKCYWSPSTLTQLIETVWLHEPGTIPVVTPFGRRCETILIDPPVDAQADNNPEQDGQEEG